MWIRSFVRRRLEDVLARFGYSVKLADAPPRGYAGFLDLYRSLAPAPRTVVDIGVGYGTSWLYEAFPQAHFVLIEALEDFRPSIEEILKRYDAECHYCCLGKTEGEAEFLVRPGVLTSSGMYAMAGGYRESWGGARTASEQVRRVPMRTLDSIAAGAAPPMILKIDVEGAEMDVLQGGESTLASADMILVETSIASRFEGGPDLIELGGWLKARGFALFEIVEFSTAGPRRITSYVDAAFLRLDSEAYRSLTAGPDSRTAFPSG